MILVRFKSALNALSNGTTNHQNLLCIDHIGDVKSISIPHAFGITYVDQGIRIQWFLHAPLNGVKICNNAIPDWYSLVCDQTRILSDWHSKWNKMVSIFTNFRGSWFVISYLGSEENLIKSQSNRGRMKMK